MKKRKKMSEFKKFILSIFFGALFICFALLITLRIQYGNHQKWKKGNSHLLSEVQQIIDQQQEPETQYCNNSAADKSVMLAKK